MDRTHLLRQVTDLQEVVRQAATRVRPGLSGEAAVSAANLLAYRALRSQDIADLQVALADVGLSSLGRLEANVLDSLENVRAWLASDRPARFEPDRHEGLRLAEGRATRLFGRPRPSRNTRIMVTLDVAVPDPVPMAVQLLRAGMDVARINAAHGRPEDWQNLAESVRQAERELERSGTPAPRRCRILFDLSGPRLRVGQFEGELRLGAGDRLRLLRSPLPVSLPAEAVNPPAVPCSEPAALAVVGPGQPVAIDGGRFAGSVVDVTDQWVEVLLDTPAGSLSRLRPEKGLNFPGLTLPLTGLTGADIASLDAAAPFADLFGLSFVHGPSDIARLAAELERRRLLSRGVIAKIETRAAAHALTPILLEGLQLPAFGVMIARGDLAVEVGWDDLALYQEAILCLCEAAHLPSIWATQVLETLARRGTPARPEITDAAAATRADCVMLNKGPYVGAAVRLLDRLLASEHRNRLKKRELFREFIAQDDLGNGPPSAPPPAVQGL
jgi:pyruvate kinase